MRHSTASPRSRSGGEFARRAGLLLLGLALWGCDRPTEPIDHLEVAARSIQAGALSADGRWALVGSGNHGGSLWRVDDGERLFNWNHKADTNTLILSASFAADAHYALTTDERTLVLWNRETGAAEQYWSSPAGIVMAQLGADGERALLALEDYRAALYNVRRGGIIRNFHHSDHVSAIAMSEHRAVTGSDAGTATLWNLDTGEVIVSRQHDAPVQAVAIAPQGDRILSAARYEPPQVWSAEGELLWELPLPEERVRRGARVSLARFSDDGGWLLTGQPTGRVDLWDVDNRTLAYSWQLPKRKAFHPTAVAVLALAFTEDPNRYRAISSDGFVYELGY